MPSKNEHRSAFFELVELLRQSVGATARAREQQHAAPVAALLERQLEHGLMRLARLEGSGVYEYLSVSEILVRAINMEARLESELQLAAAVARSKGSTLQVDHADAAAQHERRIRSLLEVGLRGRRINVPPGPEQPSLQRGVFVEPFSPELRDFLFRDRCPFVHWREGVLAAVEHEAIEEIRALGAAATILYLDAGDLQDAILDWEVAELDAPLEQRLRAATASAEHPIHPEFESHVDGLYFQQSTVLRNLALRLESAHPMAHRALQPITLQNRASIEARQCMRLRATTAAARLLTHVANQEHLVMQHAQRWLDHARAEDAAGMRYKFQLVVEAESLLGELRTTAVQEPAR